MDFVLGILVGVALCMAYGQYATNQARKHQREQQREMMGYFFGQPKGGLDELLAEAIAREDFKEAARLRDMIEKMKK